MPVIIPGPNQDPIPATDADLDEFGQVFAAGWVPATFNVVLPLAATISAASAQFTSDLMLATDPATRTPVTIANKNASRVALVLILRGAIQSAQAAYLAGTATEGELNAIGIRANSTIRTSIGTPTYAPILGGVAATAGTCKIRLTQVDPNTGNAVATRRYPYGYVGAEVERKIATGSWLANQTVRRVNIMDSTVGIPMGTLIYYRARYQTARGDVGPWSNEIVCAVV
jgi:hypothetical protein